VAKAPPPPHVPRGGPPPPFFCKKAHGSYTPISRGYAGTPGNVDDTPCKSRRCRNGMRARFGGPAIENAKTGASALPILICPTGRRLIKPCPRS